MLIVTGANDPAAAVRYQIDTPVASVRTDGPGEYPRRRAGPPRRRDRTGSGARVRDPRDRTRHDRRPRRRTHRGVRERRARRPQTFNSARFDAFDRWAAGRRDARMAASSAQYLPRDCDLRRRRSIGTARGRTTAPYGYVWYPTVDADWRPYYDGYWSPIRSVRLDVDRRRPLVVADASLRPLGSCRRPLVLDSRPHVGTGLGVVGGGARIRELVPARLRQPARVRLSIGAGDPWAGWTVVPRRSFGGRDYHVNRYAIQAHRLPRTRRSSLQSRRARRGAPLPGAVRTSDGVRGRARACRRPSSQRPTAAESGRHRRRSPAAGAAIARSRRASRASSRLDRAARHRAGTGVRATGSAASRTGGGQSDTPQLQTAAAGRRTRTGGRRVARAVAAVGCRRTAAAERRPRGPSRDPRPVLDRRPAVARLSADDRRRDAAAARRRDRPHRRGRPATERQPSRSTPDRRARRRSPTPRIGRAGERPRNRRRTAIGAQRRPAAASVDRAPSARRSHAVAPSRGAAARAGESPPAAARAVGSGRAEPAARRRSQPRDTGRRQTSQSSRVWNTDRSLERCADDSATNDCTTESI